ncbi:MAG: alpha/beta hydrolase family protein [Clostridia bacterium]|nr:alpha/beta hydrolase family protein [Clostridia bacterium]
MALITCDFISKSLMRTVTIKAVIPTDKLKFGPDAGKKEAPKKYKTLYLLHGVFGNYTDWVSGTRIQRWADEKDLIVIMPSGENKFYVDNPHSGDNFSKFIGEELVEFTRKTFPCSEKPEDTFIAGLSMGGYGALTNGLKYNETFGSVATLSAALILNGAYASEYDESGWTLGNRYYYESFFGPIEKLEGSDKDYYALIDNLVKDGKKIPNLYMCCGTEDTLFPENERYHKHLEKLGVEHTWDIGPGVHDWNFWDSYIQNVLAWLPLDNAEAGINSGNVQTK